MTEGGFPVRYLGVPLINKSLIVVDCEGLVAKFTSRIDSWCAKHLSFAGRLQLISFEPDFSGVFVVCVWFYKVYIQPKKKKKKSTVVSTRSTFRSLIFFFN
jgi:hypothetical protein